MEPEQQQPMPPPPYDATPAPAPKPRRKWPVALAIVLAGVLGIGGCAYVVTNVARNVSAEFKSVGDAVLGKIAQGDCVAVWDEAAPELRQAVSREQLVNVCKATEAKVGKPVSWTVKGFNKQSSVTAAGPKSITTINYAVKHERGASQATITVDKDHRLLAVRFDWQ